MRQTIQFISKLGIVLVLFAVLFSYAMFQGGFVSWFLFYGFLPFLLYMIGVLVYPIQNWKMKRELSRRTASAGEEVKVTVTFTRKLPFPIYYCVIEEYFPDSLKWRETHLDKYRKMGQADSVREDRRVKFVAFPWFSKKIRFTYTLDSLPRGEHQLNALRMKTGDFFGFVKKEQVFMSDEKLVVFPQTRPVKMKERVYSFEQGASPSFKLNEKNTNIVTGVREYMPGDRFAWVDWKTTARKNEMMTKEFEQEKSVDQLLVLNATYRSEQNPLRFEGAVELSASLLEELHKTSSQLAFLTLGDRRGYFPFQNDHNHKQVIRGHLAKVRPLGRQPFARQLEKETANIPAGIISMVISHTFDDELKNALIKLAKKSKRVVFFYICPANEVTFHDHQLMKQLKNQGVVVNLLSEEQLAQKKFEVNT